MATQSPLSLPQLCLAHQPDWNDREREAPQSAERSAELKALDNSLRVCEQLTAAYPAWISRSGLFTNLLPLAPEIMGSAGLFMWKCYSILFADANVTVTRLQMGASDGGQTMGRFSSEF